MKNRAANSRGKAILSANAYNTALSALASYTSVPLTDATIGRTVLIPAGEPFILLRFAGTTTANHTFTVRVHGLQHVRPPTDSGVDTFAPVPMVTATVTLGALTLGTPGAPIESAAALWADTIAKTTTEASPFINIYSPADDTIAAMLVDGTAFDAIVVDVTRAAGSAVTIDVIANQSSDQQAIANVTGTLVGTIAGIGSTTDDVLAAETLEDSTARTGVSLWKRAVNKLIAILAGLGTPTADCVADNTTAAATATAATGIGLWKRIVNLLIAIHNHFGVAGTANAGVLSVQGIASGTTLPVTEASAAAIAADTNELTAAPVAKTLTVVTKAVTTSGTGVPLVATETFARKVWLCAKKDAGANTGVVYLGTATVDATTPQQIELAPGDIFVLEMPAGTKIDLATIYIDCAAANTDGVTGWYIPV